MQGRTVAQALFCQRFPVPRKYFNIVKFVFLWGSGRGPKGAHDLFSVSPCLFSRIWRHLDGFRPFRSSLRQFGFSF